MIKIKIISVGKTKESWLEEAIQEYVKRLTNLVSFEFIWAKDDPHLLEIVRKEASFICLDPSGRLLSSEGFTDFITREWEKGGSRLTLVIGGAAGLPLELKAGAVLISLSPLTFTHQITRLVLVEQIYRATEINKGSHYHK